MTTSIQELEQLTHPDPATIDAFLEGNSFPLVDGRTATFVYRGAADQVHLRHWIYGLPSSQPFRQLQRSPLWYLTMDLPEKSRVEYKLELVRGDTHQLIMDPLNPHLARDPYGANSVVMGSGYEHPDWAHHDPESREGTIEELQLGSDVFGEARPVLLYVPARFRESRKYPLLIVHDGEDYLRFTGLKTILDNLIHRLEIPPMIVAMIQAGNRMTEYADDPRHADFLRNELVPLLESRFPLVAEPAGRGLMGASFGAVASLAAAWRHPGFFGRALLQSGSFAFTDIGEHDRGPAFDTVVEFVNNFRRNPGRPTERMFLSCGMYESLIYYNRSLLPLLQSTGMAVRYRESRDGHNWENWRDRLREGLSWLFPGPLWMVYE